MVGTRLLVLAVVAVWSSQVLVTSGQASGPGSSPPRSLPTDFGFDPQSALLMDLISQQSKCSWVSSGLGRVCMLGSSGRLL